MSAATITLHDDGQAIVCNLSFTGGFDPSSCAHQVAMDLVNDRDEIMGRQGAAVVDQAEADPPAILGRPTDGEKAVAAIMKITAQRMTEIDAQRIEMAEAVNAPRTGNTTLCERCFPTWGDHEILTIVPMTPCVVCGQYDERRSGGVSAHLFRGDPRSSLVAPQGHEG